MTWSGLFTALITPFKEDKLDEEGFVTLLERQKAAGVKGVVLLGTTGESATLNSAEKTLLLKLAKKHLGPLQLIVGIGHASTMITVDNGLWAEDLGADAFLVVTPYYNKPTQEGLYRHYETLALKTKTPFFAYNNPHRTGINIEIDTLKKIAALPSMVGIKESPLHFSQFLDILQELPHLTLLCGEDLLTYPLLAVGGHGVISVVSNLFPKRMQQMVAAAHANRLEEAKKGHQELFPLLKALLMETNPITIKAAMDYVKLPAGSPRLPLTPLSAKNLDFLGTLLNKYAGVS